MKIDLTHIIAEAKDVTTSPKRLDEIYSGLTDICTKYQKRQIVETIALNPNTNPDTIKDIFQRYEGMADKIVQQNPVISLLQLSNPQLLKEWISERSHPIFHVPTSLQLQKIALSTKNLQTYRNLASSKYVAKEIIEAIISSIKIKASTVEEKWLRQELVKNQHTTAQLLIHIVQEISDWKNHEHAWININSHPHKKQTAIDYFQSLNTVEQKWANNLIPKLENLLTEAKTKGFLYEDKYGYKSFVIDDEYKIEVLPEAGIKVLYHGTTYLSRRLIFNYDIQSLQVFVSKPERDDMQFWHDYIN